MSFDYQFSVGTMTIRKENVAGPEVGVGVMTEINVSYDGDPQSFFGGDYRLPLAIELGNRTGEVTAMSSRWTTNDAMMTNNYVDVILGFGPNGGGLTGSIQACKVTNYSISSTQNDFVTSDITLNIADPGHISKGTVPPTWNSNV
jgi:hypothetical protein